MFLHLTEEIWIGVRTIDRNDRIFRKRRNRKRELLIKLICSVICLLLVIGGALFLLNSRNRIAKYETSTYHSAIYEAELFADKLCVTNKDVEFEEFYTNDEFKGALLFNIKDKEVLFSEHVNEKLYPASTTKILTAYLALKYGDLKDYVTISETAVDVPSDSSSAHLKVGDVLTLEDLLYALMLPSGNDSAVAIAEHISGNVEDFVDLMNEEANQLGASNTHFINPHGYQDKNHYTTAYDLYLIFNECIKNENFLEIVSSKNWSTVITQKDGSQRDVTWGQSNQFITGTRKTPNGITFIGGKTGNTYDAGSCLVMYGKDATDTPYISIMMGATSRRNLYDNMTFLWAAISK